MAMKFFKNVFAKNGDVQPVSDAAAGDGTVSYDEGYTTPYELLQDNPAKKNVEREKLNQVLKDITTSLQLWQTIAYPEFITSAMNGGSPYSYKKDAFVRGDGHAGEGIYFSLNDDNEEDLSDDSAWAKFDPLFDALPVGTVLEYDAIDLPPKFLWANGQTIGNAASNATARANADTYDLFAKIWSSFSNAARPILTSAGAASTRGASAQADFDAGKQLPIIDRRHRTAVGYGPMGGTVTPALLTNKTNGINGDVMGAVGGKETDTLTADTIPAHHHKIYNGTNSGGGSLDDGENKFLRDRGSQGGGNNDYALLGNTIAPTLGRVSTVGNGQAHNNVQPSIVTNFIIKY